MVIPNLPNSENSRLRKDGNTFPNQTHNSSKTAGFRFILTKARLPDEKRDYESGAWQRRVKLSITVATLSKFTLLSKISKLKRESLPSLQNLLPFGVEGSAGLPNLPKLPFSEFGSQERRSPIKTTAVEVGLYTHFKSSDRDQSLDKHLSISFNYFIFTEVFHSKIDQFDNYKRRLGRAACFGEWLPRSF